MLSFQNKPECALLASVSNLEEALSVLAAGVDIIDLKAPAAGALGALPVAQVEQICQHLQGQRPVSATIGDLPAEPDNVLTAVQQMQATGVDYVKIGFFPGGDWLGTIEALQQTTAVSREPAQLIAVLFADQAPDWQVVIHLAQAGFAGVMLDTMDKTGGSLLEVLPMQSLQAFVQLSHKHSLLCGLAGSLRQADIQPLRALKPDYLGFRGALCDQQQRTGSLDADAVERIVALFNPPLEPV